MRSLSLWLPVIVYMAIIFSLSAQSNPLPEVTAHVWDKLLHASEYGGLAVLLVRALRGEGVGWAAVLIAATVVASLYGASDEIHQAFVPGRDPAVGDWLADTTGAAIVSALATLVGRRTSDDERRTSDVGRRTSDVENGPRTSDLGPRT